MKRILENVAIGACALLGGAVMVILALAIIGKSNAETSKGALPANTPASGVRNDTSSAYQRPLEPIKESKLTTITLNENNSVVMDQVFDDESVNKVMRDLQKISASLSKDEPIYLVLNTPGGSVTAGMKLIAFANALPQKVKTLTIFAASMGFHTAQGLDERLITKGGTMMSHPASFGVQGSTPYQVVSRLKWILEMIDDLDQHAADRMGLSLESYKGLIHDEYWVNDVHSVKDQAADRTVGVRCGKFSAPTKWIAVSTMFGNVEVEVSSCPIIPGIISFKMAANTSNAVLNYVRQMLTDREAFTKNYIVNNKFLEFQRE